MTELYAEVIVDIANSALDRGFHYAVPERLRDRVCVGATVSVPFGKSGRVVRGYVVDLTDKCEYDPEKIKPVMDVLTDEETAEARLVSLAVWISEHYACGMIQALRTVLPSRRKMPAKVEQTLWLGTGKPEADAIRAGFEEKRAVAKARVLSALLAEDGLKRSLLMKNAHVPGSVIDGLIRDGILIPDETETMRGGIRAGEIPGAKIPELTEAQKEALCGIRKEWEKGKPVLLHGETGSGKTLLYMELIEETLREGKQAIVLIPEIALTYQTVRRFVGRFGNQVSFLHSRLSEGEKYDLHKEARKGNIRIMIGPRSALFTPFPDLGLIIIDEEHEDTYRSESTPRYDARETAEKRCRIEGAKLLFGSATPSILTYERTRAGEVGLVRLRQRFGSSQRTVRIVDMKQELKNGNRSVLSDELRARLENVLAGGHQAMLFLNRRGYAGFVSCRSCGFVLKCPHCDVSLTEHADGTMICHYCGHTQPKLARCPSCGSPAVGGMRIGTQQVEKQIAAAFPEVRVARMDRDTTGGKEGHSKILKQFASGGADILIGTQMIVKGHDFPEVALIGVLAADLSLNDADYRSAERTYALIAQAIGRCGRADVDGTAVIQTYRPDHYSIEAAAADDYEAFFEEEISFRSLMDYPPCAEMMAVLGTCADEDQLSAGMRHIRNLIDRIDPKGSVHALGPAPLSVRKIRDRYRQAVYLRNPDHGVLVRVAERIAKYVRANSGFDKITIQFDFNV